MSVQNGETFCFYCDGSEQGDDGGSTTDALRLVRTLRLFRLVKLLRILRASRIITRWQDFYGFSFANMTLIRLLMTIAMLLHWYTCLWAFTALQGLPGVDLEVLDNTWVKNNDMQQYADGREFGPSTQGGARNPG